MAEAEVQDGKPVIYAVSIKPGIFKESAVSGWFLTLEAQFNINKITSQSTRFYHTLAALPPELATNLPQEVQTSENYDQLKKNILDIYEQTKPELFDKLIKKTTLSGRPSVFLHELHSIAKKVGVGEELVRHKFLNALPKNIAPIAASQKTLDLTHLGILADELMPYLNESQNITTINATSHAAPHSMHQRDSSRPRNRDQQDSTIPYGIRPYKPNQRPKVCKSHLYYGTTARNCKPWCQWPQKNNCKILPNSRPASPARQEN